MKVGLGEKPYIYLEKPMEFDSLQKTLTKLPDVRLEGFATMRYDVSAVGAVIAGASRMT